ncbi:MFS transporter [Phototrophicus methaneseepsis]|uniref:MFS transporter n=1 Tax=Phototrophicus methaneseepsis TaxID=2710758 RepID=A0A7S8E8P8_9CHLR|nr:MFS transporter [Phototrophicus methaneseepsis]QPC82412.1 MFS transporter [Phototrophicus methaneseepsis]
MSEKPKNSRASNSGLRTFYTIVLTQTLSLIGSRISGLAIGIWLYNETGNATPLALVAFFSMLPMVLASSFAGVLADRWDRRYVMAISDGGQAIGTVLLMMSFLSGDFQIWHLYFVTALQSLFGAFQGPAFTASVTMLVPDDQRDRANSLMQISQPTAGVIAPAIAGFMFAWFGVVGTLVFDLLTFFVAFAVILMVHIPRPRKSQEASQYERSMLADMTTGFRYLWQRQPLLWAVLFVSLLNFLVSGAGVLFTPYILARTGSEQQLGILLSLMDLGMLAGGIVMSAWGGTRPRIHTAMISAIFLCIFLMLAGLAQSFPALIIISTIILFPNMFTNAAFMSIMQTKIAPDMQGRVFASLQQVSTLLIPIAYLIVGPLADHVFEPAVQTEAWAALAPFFGSEAGAGMGLQIFIYGGLALIASIIMYATPSVRNMEATLPDYMPETDEDETSIELEVGAISA